MVGKILEVYVSLIIITVFVSVIVNLVSEYDILQILWEILVRLFS